MKKTATTPAQEPQKPLTDEKSPGKQPDAATPATAPEAGTDNSGNDAASPDAPDAPGNGTADVPATESQAPEAPAQTPGEAPATDESFQRQLAEAEQRGYLRGRNESIEQLMREPAPLERPSAACQPAAETQESAPMILNNPRVSIWDR